MNPRGNAFAAGGEWWRGAALVLAFLTIALVVLRPFCDHVFPAARLVDGEHVAAAAKQDMIADRALDGASIEICCDSIDDAAPVAKLTLLAGWATSGAAGILAGAPRHRIRNGFANLTAKIASPPYPERSYYARSARIQR